MHDRESYLSSSIFPSTIFLDSLQLTLAALYLEEVGYTLYAIQNGGAMFDWLRSCGIQDIIMRGRCEFEDKHKHYLYAEKPSWFPPLFAQPCELLSFLNRLCRTKPVLLGMVDVFVGERANIFPLSSY